MHKLILDNLRVYDNRGVKIYDFDVQKFPRINTTIVQVLREIHSLVSKEHKYSNPAKLGLKTKAPFWVSTSILSISRKVSHTVLGYKYND